MQLTTGEIALMVTAVTLTMGLLAVFFILIASRYYRLNVRRHLQLLNAVIETQDNERRRIAEDMHDGLGQLLAAAKLQADALRHASAQQLPEAVTVVKDTLDRASGEVRNVIQDLVPRKLEREGLWKALEDLTLSIGALGDLQTRFESNANGRRFHPRVELNLYRIVQELLTNAVKHAGAAEIVVRLNQTPQQLLVEVTDDGQGFTDRETSAGNGLRNIQSRAEWLHGAFALSANAPRGTRAELVFNVENLEARA